MRIRLVKLDDISGNKTTFYSVYYNKDENSLFKQFLENYVISFNSEILEIYNRLKVMGHGLGAREHFFKHEEGVPGDLVCALYDNPEKKLRLYCIRYSDKLVLLGSGGVKPKKISALQDDPVLKRENQKVVQIARLIETRKNEGEIFISFNGLNFEGIKDLKDDYYEE